LSRTVASGSWTLLARPVDSVTM